MKFFWWVFLGLLGVWLYARFAAFLANLFDGDADYYLGGLESYKRCCEKPEINNLGHCAGCGMDWTV
jgi:hypothetical protein